MSNSTFRIMFRFVVMLMAIVVLSPSCKKDDKLTANYSGKWISEKPIAVATGYVSIKYHLELRRDGFKEVFIKPERSSYPSASQLKLIFEVDYNKDGIYAENEKSIYSRL